MKILGFQTVVFQPTVGKRNNYRKFDSVFSFLFQETTKVAVFTFLQNKCL